MTGLKLMEDIKKVMDREHKHFLISFEQGNPLWEESPYAEFAEYPSVKWKLLNLNKLKKTNSKKLEKESNRLREILE